MSTERTSHPWSTFLWGALFLTAGTIFWLDRLGEIDARDWVRWWPVALLIAGLAHVPQRRWVAALAYMVIGTFFLLPKLGYYGLDAGDVIGLWPLLITYAGVTLIVQTLRRTSGAQFRAVAVMAGNHVAIGSRQFAGGQAIAVMGGVDIDLTSAMGADGDAVIDVLAFWGGIDIQVPRGWKVVNRVAPVLGGFEDKTESAPPSAPRVIVRGAAIMGGVEVGHLRNRKQRTAEGAA